jgi:hypothetical protein
MKNSTKSVKSVATVNSVAKGKGGNSALVTDSAAQRSKVSGFNRFDMFKLALTGVDFFTTFCGSQIADKLAVELRSRINDLLGASLSKAKSAVLMVDARVIFAWNVKVAGDVYARAHIDDAGKAHEMRGSIGALQAQYGKGNVRLVSLSELAKLAKSKKVDKGCATALGLKLASAASEESE